MSVLSGNPLSLTDEKNPLEIKKKDDPVFVKYEVDQAAPGAKAGMKHRVVKIVQEQVDLLEPSRFRHKKAPKSPGSPPPAVMHSPTRKLTEEDQANWKIPPCVSLWKNEKGYTIPLDKRIAGDGRYLKEQTISDKFSSFTDALGTASDLAREEVKLRNDIRLHQKAEEARKQEDDLLAKAREIRKHREEAERMARAHRPVAGETKAEAEARLERLELDQARKREIERDFRIERSKKRFKHGERDISEKIALGQATATAIGGSIAGGESMFDSRLFDKTSGLGSGFDGDDVNDQYEKGLWEQMRETKKSHL